MQNGEVVHESRHGFPPLEPNQFHVTTQPTSAPLARDEIERLYRLHRASAQRRARSILGDAAAADDVAQDVFMQLLARPDQFQGRSSFSTYIYRVVTNRCLQRLRDTKNRVRLLDERGAEVRGIAGESVQAEKLILLRQMLQRVPDDLAAVAVYFYVDAMTYEQIAELLQCSRRHVSELLTRFRESCAALARAEAA